MATIEDSDVQLAQLLSNRGGGPWLADLEFRRCRILGPMVLMANGLTIQNCANIHGQMFLPLYDLGRGYAGLVGTEDVVFDDCRFSAVGFAAPVDDIDRLIGAGEIGS